MPIDALLHLDHHRFDADDRIVDQEAEREDQRAERNPLQADPATPMYKATIASVSGTDSATTIPSASRA